MFCGIFLKDWKCPYLCRVRRSLPKVIFSNASRAWVGNHLSLCQKEPLEQLGVRPRNSNPRLPQVLPGDTAGLLLPRLQLDKYIVPSAHGRGIEPVESSRPVSVFSQKDCLWTDVMWCFSPKLDSGERKCLSITEVLCRTAIFNLENDTFKVLRKIFSTVTTFFVSRKTQPCVICKVPAVLVLGDCVLSEAGSAACWDTSTIGKPFPSLY